MLTKTGTKNYNLVALSREQIIASLTRFRQTTEDVVGRSEPLVEVNLSVGLVIQDIARCLGLSEDEIQRVMGQQYYDTDQPEEIC